MPDGSIREGDWTPRIGGSTSESGQSYSTQLGSWKRIGNLVYIHAAVTLSVLGTITGNVRIKGLPFRVAAINFRQCPILWDNTVTNYVYLCGFFVGNVGAKDIELRALTAAGAGLAVVAQANIQAGTSFFASGCYETDEP